MMNATTWENALRTRLENIFNQMNSGDESKDDKWFAGQLAAAIAATGTDQIRTAAVPAGRVVIGATAAVLNPAPINVA